MLSQTEKMRRELVSLYRCKSLVQAISARNELARRRAPAWLIALINDHLNSALMNVRIAGADDATYPRLKVAFDRAELRIRSAKSIAYSFLRRDLPPSGGLLWLEDYEQGFADFLNAQAVDFSRFASENDSHHRDSRQKK